MYSKSIPTIIIGKGKAMMCILSRICINTPQVIKLKKINLPQPRKLKYSHPTNYQEMTTSKLQNKKPTAIVTSVIKTKVMKS